MPFSSRLLGLTSQQKWGFRVLSHFDLGTDAGLLDQGSGSGDMTVVAPP